MLLSLLTRNNATEMPQIKGNMPFYLNEEHHYCSTRDNEEDTTSRTSTENARSKNLFTPGNSLQKGIYLSSKTGLFNTSRPPTNKGHCIGHTGLTLLEDETLPQPGQIFESHEQFMEYLNSNARRWNFYISCRDSRISLYNTYMCVYNKLSKRLKYYKSKGIRKKPSKKTNCPCLIKTKPQKEGSDAVVVSYVCYHHDHPLTKEAFHKLSHGKHFPPHLKQEIKDLLYVDTPSEVMIQYVLSQTGHKMGYRYFNNMRRAARASPRDMSENELKLVIRKHAELEKLYGEFIKKKKASTSGKRIRKTTKDNGKKSSTQCEMTPVMSTMSTDKDMSRDCERPLLTEITNTDVECERPLRKHVNTKGSYVQTSLKKRKYSEPAVIDRTHKKSRLESRLEEMSNVEETLISVQKLQESMSEHTEWQSSPVQLTPDVLNSSNYIEHFDKNTNVLIRVPRVGHNGEIKFVYGNDVHQNETCATRSNETNKVYDNDVINQASETHEDDSTERENYAVNEYDHMVEYDGLHDDLNDNNLLSQLHETYEENENACDEITRFNTVNDSPLENVLTERCSVNKAVNCRSTNQSAVGETNDINKINDGQFDLGTDDTAMDGHMKHIYINKYNIGDRLKDPDTSKYLEQVAKERGVGVLDILRNIYKGKCGISIEITNDMNRKHITITCVNDRLMKITHRSKWNESSKYNREAYCNMFMRFTEVIAKIRNKFLRLESMVDEYCCENSMLLSDVESYKCRNMKLINAYEKQNQELKEKNEELAKAKKKAEENIYKLSQGNKKLLSHVNMLEVENMNLRLNCGTENTEEGKSISALYEYVKKRRVQLELDLHEFKTAKNSLLKEISNACDLRSLELVKGQIKKTYNRLSEVRHTQEFTLNKNKSLNKDIGVVGIAPSHNSDIDTQEFNVSMNETVNNEDLDVVEIATSYNSDIDTQEFNVSMNETVNNEDLDVVEIATSHNSDIDTQEFNVSVNETVNNEDLDVVEIASDEHEISLDMEVSECWAEDNYQVDNPLRILADKDHKDIPTFRSESYEEDDYPKEHDKKKSKDETICNLDEIVILNGEGVDNSQLNDPLAIIGNKDTKYTSISSSESGEDNDLTDVEYLTDISGNVSDILDEDLTDIGEDSDSSVILCE